MKVHHTTELTEVCCICGKHILMLWKDKEEKNGQSETTSKKDGKDAHYFCMPHAKTLQQLNEERKLL